MLLLAIDTCGAPGGVALGLVDQLAEPTAQDRISSLVAQDGEVQPPADFRELVGRTFSEKLIAAISGILEEAGVSPAQLSAIVVARGPGSFTGIRIGLSAAKGLAEALQIPLIAVSRLELLARKSAAAETIAVLDAGRGEFFVGVSRRADQPGFDQTDLDRQVETLMTRDQLSALAEDSELPRVICEERVLFALEAQQLELVAAPTAVDALLLGAERFRQGVFDDIATLDANYLRRSETEMLARIAEHAAARAGGASARR